MLKSFCEHPRGSFENPLSRAQIEAKFRTYAKGVISDAQAEEVVAAVNRLEDLGSVRKLMELLRGRSKRRERRRHGVGSRFDVHLFIWMAVMAKLRRHRRYRV